MTITRARLLIIALLAVAACSAPESANRSTRCKEGLACPDGLTCYRGFCVLDDLPDTVPLDAGAEPDDQGEDAGELREASAPPTETADDATTIVTPPREAGAPESLPEASTPPGSVRDATAPSAPTADASSGGPPPDEDAGEEPVVDAGQDAAQTPPADAGMMSSPDIDNEVRLCLLICGANQQYCTTCLRGIIQRHPEVCDLDAPSGSEAVLRRLCGILCLPFCGGQ